jgi:phosphohistidine phosphatase
MLTARDQNDFSVAETGQGLKTKTVKQLTLIRHAKSSWNTPALDFDRPLNKRGRKAAPYMANRIGQYYRAPDLIVTSPALRARATAELIAKGIGYPQEKLQEDAALYDADAATLLSRIQATPNDVEHLYLVAHNPGITYLANRLTGSHIDNLVTCAVLGAALEVEHWRDAEYGTGRVIYYDYPKNPDTPLVRRGR